ncbi:hypothetical protein ACFOL3_10410, partial [Streptomyces nitrosporeus]
PAPSPAGRRPRRPAPARTDLHRKATPMPLAPAPEHFAPGPHDPDDLRLASRNLNGHYPWLDPAVPVPYGHLLAASAELGRSPETVAARLTDLGYENVQRCEGPLPAAVSPEDAALLKTVTSYSSTWLDVTEPVSLRQTVASAVRENRGPAEIARRLTALGYRYRPDHPPLPETPGPRDVLLIRTGTRGDGEWLEQGDTAHPAHVLSTAAELRCSPYTAARRLLALGIRLPYVPDPSDDLLLGHTVDAHDGHHPSRTASAPGHVLAVARETGRRPGEIAARLRELGCAAPEAELPDAPGPEDFVLLSRNLDGHAPWLPVNTVVGLRLEHVLRASLATGLSPAETVARLAGFGHWLHESARLPGKADERDVALLATTDRSYKDEFLPEHVLRSAGLTGRSPAEVAERLRALGHRVSDAVEYPREKAVLRG